MAEIKTWSKSSHEQKDYLRTLKIKQLWPSNRYTYNITTHLVGELILASVDEELCLCDWNEKPCAERNKRRLEKYMNADFKIDTSAVLEQTKKQLNEYFEGIRKTFDIPLHPIGTEFQHQVWNVLRHIPYGETRSYKHIAEIIGIPQGVRAVAGAIGANGITILIPCHRIIGSNNSLTGYAGGLKAKKMLLEIEKKD